MKAIIYIYIYIYTHTYIMMNNERLKDSITDRWEGEMKVSVCRLIRGVTVSLHVWLWRRFMTPPITSLVTSNGREEPFHLHYTHPAHFDTFLIGLCISPSETDWFSPQFLSFPINPLYFWSVSHLISLSLALHIPCRECAAHVHFSNS